MNRAESIRRTCELLASPGQVIEVRAFRKRGISSGYFTDYAKLAAKAAILDTDPEYSGIYVTLNEINPDLLARRANRIEMRLGDGDKTTADDDIIRRRWFPIDIDPKRLSGISSSHEEHDYALDKAGKIAGFLSEMGWSKPIIADSGNGAHLLYRIDLPNDPESLALVKNCLLVLSAFFTDERADIDTSVSNASRIWKLYGTISRKGDSTSDRPHRRSAIIELPDEREIVPHERLLHLASLLEEPATRENPPISGKSRRSISIPDLGIWLDSNGLSYRSKPYSQGTIYLFEDCPFSTAHKDGAYAIQFASGGIFAGCHHNSCGGGTQRWSELRERFEGPVPARDYESRIRQGIKDRAKGKVERDGYRSFQTEANPEAEKKDTRISNQDTDQVPDSEACQNLDFDPKQEAMDILLTGDPLAYSLRTFAQDHEGDEVIATCMALSLASRSIANPKSKGLHISVTGISGKGKTHAFEIMLTQIPKKFHVGDRLSDKALFYDEELRPGMVITLDDTGLSDQMQEILKGVTSSFQKPFRYKTVNKERKGVVYVIPERCVWWVAKVEGTGDDQVLNRMLTAWIDDTEEQDKKVLTRTLESASELPLPEKIERPELLVCQEMWDMLFDPVWVTIPYAKQIRFSSASNRRNPDMLIDLIRAHAILNQFQRKREEMNGVICVTATMDDFHKAVSLYQKLCGESGSQTTKMTKREAEVIEGIRSLGVEEFTIAHLQRITALSYSSLYRIIHGYSSRGVNHSGILEKCPALSVTDRAIKDEREGIHVTRKTNAYLWDTLIFDCWSGSEQCWISEVETRNNSNHKSDDDDGGDERCLQHLQHVSSTAAKEETAESSLLENNNHNYCTNMFVCSTKDSRATHHENTHESPIRSCDFASAAIGSKDPEGGVQNAENATDSEGFGLQHLLQTAGNVEKNHPSVALSDTDDPIPRCELAKAQSSSSAIHAVHSLLYSTGDIGRESPDREIRKQSESIRTLPGVLDVSRMKRTSTDYGRCRVCNLQGVIWWDDEGKIGLCQTCYERERLLDRGKC